MVAGEEDEVVGVVVVEVHLGVGVHLEEELIKEEAQKMAVVRIDLALYLEILMMMSLRFLLKQEPCGQKNESGWTN